MIITPLSSLPSSLPPSLLLSPPSLPPSLPPSFPLSLPPSLPPSLPQNPLVQPILTPRFPISCSPALLRGLGELASETGVRVQSHLCEQKPEVEFILRLFPDHSHCASIFEKNKLFGDKVFVVWLPHCTHACVY